MGLIIIQTLVRKVDLICGAVLHIVPFHVQYAVAGFPITLTYTVGFFCVFLGDICECIIVQELYRSLLTDQVQTHYFILQ